MLKDYKRFFYVYIAVAVMIALVAGGYLYLNRQHPNSTSKGNVFNENPITDMSPKEVDEAFMYSAPEDFITDAIDFFPEVVDANSNKKDLVCTKTLSRDHISYLRQRQAPVYDYLSVQDEEIRRESAYQIEEFRLCKNEEGETIVIFSTTGGAGGLLTQFHFAYFNGSGEFVANETVDNQEIERLNGNKGIPYLNCFDSTLVTKDNRWFTKCTGGDGVYGDYVQIKEIITTSNSTQVVQTCSYQLANNSGEYDLICR